MNEQSEQSEQSEQTSFDDPTTPEQRLVAHYLGVLAKLPDLLKASGHPEKGPARDQVETTLKWAVLFLNLGLIDAPHACDQVASVLFSLRFA